MRICSLLPSTTEIVCALGLGGALVGVSHECDYPPEVARLPKLTWSKITPQSSSAQIDAAVASALASGEGLYGLDVALFRRLAPTIVLTQRLCDVCAVSDDHVERALGALGFRPKVIYLEPRSLEDILSSIGQVACELGRPERGLRLLGELRLRIAAVRTTAAGAPRPRTFCMDWVDPPYCGGHWMQELVESAGGEDRLSRRHEPSCRVAWEDITDWAPEVIVLTCCGLNLGRAVEEAASLARMPGVSALPAVRNGRVFATDGSSYFSRPGPRIVDSMEILAHLFHPQLFPAPPFPLSWAKVDLKQPAVAR